jgi:hypothetical protein
MTRRIGRCDSEASPVSAGAERMAAQHACHEAQGGARIAGVERVMGRDEAARPRPVI